MKIKAAKTWLRRFCDSALPSHEENGLSILTISSALPRLHVWGCMPGYGIGPQNRSIVLLVLTRHAGIFNGFLKKQPITARRPTSRGCSNIRFRNVRFHLCSEQLFLINQRKIARADTPAFGKHLHWGTKWTNTSLHNRLCPKNYKTYGVRSLGTHVKKTDIANDAHQVNVRQARSQLSVPHTKINSANTALSSGWSRRMPSIQMEFADNHVGQKRAFIWKSLNDVGKRYIWETDILNAVQNVDGCSGSERHRASRHEAPNLKVARCQHLLTPIPNTIRKTTLKSWEDTSPASPPTCTICESK